MRCIKCGYDNLNSATYCVSCGGVLNNNAQPVINNVVVESNVERNSYKKVILILIVLIVIAMVVYFLMSLNKNNGVSSSEVASLYFDENKPIVVKSGDLYGYIDVNGKVIIPIKYKAAHDFNGNYAYVYSNGGLIIDKNGKEVLKDVKILTNITEYQVFLINNKLYDGKNFNLIMNKYDILAYLGGGYFIADGKVMDINEKVFFSFDDRLYFTTYSKANKTYTELTDDYCIVQKLGDVNHKKLYNCKTRKFIVESSFIQENDNNVFWLKNESIYVENDKIVYRQKDNMSYIGNHVLNISIDKYYDLINQKELDDFTLSIEGTKYWEKEFGVSEFTCGNDKIGLKKSNDIIIPCEYESITSVGEPLFSYMKSLGKQLLYLKTDKSNVLYDLKSNSKITLGNQDGIFIGNNANSIFTYDYSPLTEGERIIYNIITGKSKSFDRSYNISASSNYFTVQKEDKLEYYNKDFELIYTGEYH